MSRPNASFSKNFINTGQIAASISICSFFLTSKVRSLNCLSEISWIFLHDVQNGDVVVDEGKTLRDYITEYMTSAKNDQIHRFAAALGADETMLRDFMQLRVTEANINEFGRFDKLKATVNRDSAKVFLETLEGAAIKPFQINMKVDQVLRKFILEGGFDI